MNFVQHEVTSFPVHKFKIGDTVFLESSLNVPGGAYVIVRQMPEAQWRLRISDKECSGIARPGCSREPAKRNALAYGGYCRTSSGSLAIFAAIRRAGRD